MTTTTKALTTTTTTTPLGAALAHADLVERAAGYSQSSKAQHTRDAYASGWRAFTIYCEEHAEAALPATSPAVVGFMVELAERGKSVSTIGSYLAAVKHYHEHAGYPDPTNHPLVKQVHDGIRREHGKPPTKKDAISLETLRAMVNALPPTLAGTRDRALLLVGWWGAFRRSELVALERSDLRINGVVKITIRKGKTDQTGKGQVKILERLPDPDLCPVAALEAWLTAADITSGAIWRRVDRNGRILPGKLSGQTVALIVKAAGAAIGADVAGFAGHSLRRGFITTAAHGGASPLDIMAQTGHKSQQTMQGYIEDAGVQQERAIMAAFSGKVDQPA